MLLHFDDATSLTGAKLFRRNRLVILYGLHHTLELQCIAGLANTPVDMQALNLWHWELNITKTLENPSSILASAIYETNIAVEDILSVEFSTATEAMYEYVAGGIEQPAVFELKGFESDASEEATVVIQLPITLRTTVTDKCPQKLSDAMLAEIQHDLELSRQYESTTYQYKEEAAQSADVAVEAANTASTAAAIAENIASTFSEVLPEALNARTWAEGDHEAVVIIGGTFSAKGWAEQAGTASELALDASTVATRAADDAQSYSITTRENKDAAILAASIAVSASTACSSYTLTASTAAMIALDASSSARYYAERAEEAAAKVDIPTPTALDDGKVMTVSDGTYSLADGLTLSSLTILGGIARTIIQGGTITTSRIVNDMGLEIPFDIPIIRTSDAMLILSGDNAYSWELTGSTGTSILSVNVTSYSGSEKLWSVDIALGTAASVQYDDMTIDIENSAPLVANKVNKCVVRLAVGFARVYCYALEDLA